MSDRYEFQHQYDIAILTLDRPVKPADNIGSICLPAPDYRLNTGSLATVVGWGRLGRLNGSPHSSVLQVCQYQSPGSGRDVEEVDVL